jgi:hypothetical protein
MYTWEGMQKIPYEEAIERYKNGKLVFLLYDNNTEGEACNLEEIKAHYEHGGEFGIEKG